jgi:AbrB family looped-hinge helix DNA binding protein
VTTNTGKVGKLGTIVVPARLRRKFGLEEGALVISEEREEGILIRPALAVPMEVYSLARKAEFLLSNAVDPEDYSDAVEEVKRMGLDPETILHDKPAEGNKESELGR